MYQVQGAVDNKSCTKYNNLWTRSNAPSAIVCGQEVMHQAQSLWTKSLVASSRCCSRLCRPCLAIMLAVVAGIGHCVMGSAVSLFSVAGANGEGHSAGFPPAEQAPNDMVQGRPHVSVARCQAASTYPGAANCGSGGKIRACRYVPSQRVIKLQFTHMQCSAWLHDQKLVCMCVCTNNRLRDVWHALSECSM